MGGLARLMFPCLDWEQRIIEQRSLLPDTIAEQINWELAGKALRIFENLVIPDVPGTYDPDTGEYVPMRYKDNCGQWALDLLVAVIGCFTEDGVRFCREFFVLIPKKNSKALALDVEVPTLTGFKTISQIAVGDKVFDTFGRPINVVGKSKVFTGRKCYEVEFSTGEKILCDAEHLWVTDAHKDREKQKGSKYDNRTNPQPSVKTTEEIANSLYVKSGKLSINNHRLLIPEAVEYQAKELPIEPYTFGVWLGDGTSANPSLCLNNDDADEILSYIHAAGSEAYITQRKPEKTICYVSLVRNGREQPRNGIIRETMKSLGLLDNKHIPDIYLQGSIKQRTELLQGLLDTDGTISNHAWPQISITSVFPRLAKNILELAKSLGLKATLGIREAKCNGKVCGDAYTVTIYNAKFPIFKLSRKADKQKYGKNRIGQRSKYRQIVNVKEVESVDTQCIEVDSADGQFLITRDYIPTHNTTIGAAIMLVVVLLNKRPNAEFVVLSPSIDVSRLAFSQLKGMIAADPALTSRFKVRDTINIITHKKTGAFLKIKSTNPRVATGAKPAGILIDELHVIGEMPQGRRVMGQMRGGMVSQPESFMITITTQSELEPNGIFAEELKKARNVRDGKLDIALCPLIYEFPSAVDWRNPENWYMVNPNDGYSVRVERLEEDYKIALVSGEGEIRRWASQHLNVEIGVSLTTNSWPGAYFWEENEDPKITPSYIIDNCDKIVIGIDGGGLNDMLGLCILGRLDGADMMTSQWVAWFKAWLHPLAVTVQTNLATRSAYIDFCLQGDLEIDEAIGTDIMQLSEIAYEAERYGNLEKVGVDPVGIGGIIDALVAAGVPETKIVAVPQGYRLNGAIKTAERKLAEGKLKVNSSKMMRWCAGNAKVEIRGSATFVTKQASGNAKIDPLMALFNSTAILSMIPEKKTEVEDWIA